MTPSDIPDGAIDATVPIQVDTQSLRLVDVGCPEIKPQRRSPLRPELRKAADASWKQFETAYRYLGR